MMQLTFSQITPAYGINRAPPTKIRQPGVARNGDFRATGRPETLPSAPATGRGWLKQAPAHIAPF